jgi:DNA uptake protein ComE-like DNA-binding protein
MTRVKLLTVAACAALTLVGTVQTQAAQPAGSAQGTQQALIDPNVATEKELATVPHVTPVIAKAIVAKRPFATVTDLDAVLKQHKLTPEQLADVHQKMFVRLDLNTATDEEILAIPGIGKRMLHEFKEYRPYKSIEQFRKEIGKYIDKDKREAELARLERYVIIK